MARPRLDAGERRTRTIGVRVTAAELSAIAERAGAIRLTTATYMRRRSLGEPVQQAQPARRLGTAEFRELVRIGVNLNQVARSLNTGAAVVPAGTREAVERVGELVEALVAGEL